MKTLSKKEYAELPPKSKGYACYMQAAWNKNIADVNPYQAGTQEHKEFQDGSFMAMLDAQDDEH